MSLALTSHTSPVTEIYNPSREDMYLARLAISIVIDELGGESDLSLKVKVVKILVLECGMSLKQAMCSFKRACSVLP